MKKVEEIYNNNYNLNKDEEGYEVFYRWEVFEAIKEAQEDATRETVRECAISLRKVSYPSTTEQEQIAILSVADKLIKEIQDGNKD